ncbi:MAG: HsdR family type I site-specific deoxyribonuclease [Candidatus Brocadiae bacterium]|nr:HsdR family type I site-specific deoxyribonuclease [Candidatus Brocadiia bacterium]
MATFNEKNSVESFVIGELTGTDFPPCGFLREKKDLFLGQVRWQYVSASELSRKSSDILVESLLAKSLKKLNPAIEEQPDRADEVIHKLRGLLITVQHTGLVRANEQFSEWLKGEKTMPYGINQQHIPIRLIDFEKPENNSFLVTNQYTVATPIEKIPDIVLLINGIPLVVGELKTPVRPSVSWYDGASDIHDDYENSVPSLFVPNVFSFATEGKYFRYGSIRMPLEIWGPWREEARKEDSTSEVFMAVGLEEVRQAIRSLLHPLVVLDILQHFTIFATDRQNRKIKILCRYQQYDATNLIVQRVIQGKIDRGLVWHFQGSGKSLLMVFAAQKLRSSPVLKNPTILIVVDRTDLDTQITATFNASEIPNVVTTDSREELKRLLQEDTRKIIITMIHKFGEAEGILNEHRNIIVLVDEAHRTQEGDLGRKMRKALPNAFLFGLTGTPINRRDRNTFYAFGSQEDENGYLSRYSFQQSIQDQATLPLHFEPRLVSIHVDKEQIDLEFSNLTRNLQEEDRRELSRRAAQMSHFIKTPDRIEKIVGDIVKHYKEKVAPGGFKAQIVCYDRETCILYKKALDKITLPEYSQVVMTVSEDEYKDYKLSKEDEEKVLDKFRAPDSTLQFLIVTSKLLAGFDAPILQTMYLDKPLKDHNLLQGICRTNRPYKGKSHGLIVDYFGVFDDVARALDFDEEAVRQVVTNIQQLKDNLEKAMMDCLAYFPDIDRSAADYNALLEAQKCLSTNERRDAFARDFSYLERHWEAISPDACLNSHEDDYKWLSSIYQSIKPVNETGRLIWHALGAKTLQLIHKNIYVQDVNDKLETVMVNADILDEFIKNQNPKKIKEVEVEIAKRIAQHPNNPKFIALSERLQRLNEQAQQGIINSIEFLKYLIKIAEDLLKAEKEETSKQEQNSAKAALTELFNSLKTPNTPKIIENIVNNIDEIVRIVRFEGWQNTTKGQREVKQALRKTLFKYKLHQDQDLFEKAYKYIEQYY